MTNEKVPIMSLLEKTKFIERVKESLFYEKIPLFVLAGASSLVTFLVQQKGGSVKSLEIYSVDVRIANALNSYIGYIGKTFWPHRLGVLYPHPGVLPIWQTAAAFFLLVIFF